MGTYSWPGIPSEPIEETKKEYLIQRQQELMLELRSPPLPEATCLYKDCLTSQKNNPFPPSQNIYTSDPDYKGYYKVLCRLNCQLAYHKTCWVELKQHNIDILRLTKTPSEKDFFGQPCFTPDCAGVIKTIEINDECGKVTILQDLKLIEKLDEEEKRHKEEARQKREKEEEEKRIRKLEEKLKKNKNRDRNKKQNATSDETKVKQAA